MIVVESVPITYSDAQVNIICVSQSAVKLALICPVPSSLPLNRGRENVWMTSSVCYKQGRAVDPLELQQGHAVKKVGGLSTTKKLIVTKEVT